jgi:hypothetical protein
MNVDDLKKLTYERGQQLALHEQQKQQLLKLAEFKGQQLADQEFVKRAYMLGPDNPGSKIKNKKTE